MLRIYCHIFDVIGGKCDKEGWKRYYNVLLIGLDNAGKTTLLYFLSDGETQHQTVRRRGSVELKFNGTRIMKYDLGGRRQARPVWYDYVSVADGILFMVDAADSVRFEEARQELDSLLHDELVADVPVAVLGNKIDRKEAAEVDELATSLGLTSYRTGKECVEKDKLSSRPLELFPCSIVRRVGYGEAFRWLIHYMKQ